MGGEVERRRILIRTIFSKLPTIDVELSLVFSCVIIDSSVRKVECQRYIIAVREVEFKRGRKKSETRAFSAFEG